MTRRKTNKEFIEEVYDLVRSEYTFLEEYVTSKIKIQVRHNKYGNQWKVQPNELLRGSRCPNCRFENIYTLVEGFLNGVYGNRGVCAK